MFSFSSHFDFLKRHSKINILEFNIDFTKKFEVSYRKSNFTVFLCIGVQMSYLFF